MSDIIAEQFAALMSIQRAARLLLETLPPLDGDSTAGAWAYTLAGRLEAFDARWAEGARDDV